jgi:hypothetical protein
MKPVIDRQLGADGISAFVSTQQYNIWSDLHQPMVTWMKFTAIVTAQFREALALFVD